MSRKLNICEYSPFIDKIRNKLRGWATKSLSYAGRAQLLASVIYGTINFWISTFMLPKGCIKSLESLCSRFLWSGSIECHSKAKVAWSTVCLPKNEGGLGLRSLSTWNSTLCLRLIWLLFSGSGSLWVAWQKHHHRLDSLSFWDIKVKNSDSWFWKSILKLRHLAKNFIRCSIGNGNLAWFWHDYWTPFGPLLDKMGETGPSALRVNRNARVSAAFTTSGWSLASPRSDLALSLQVFLTTIQLPIASNENDSYDWYIEGKACRGFSSSKTWQALRPRATVKDWASLIWFKGSTPKHAFHMWIANLDRLPTRSKLASWGMQITTDCCLCGGFVETRDHIFLHCSYAQTLWTLCLSRLRLTPFVFLDWSALLAWSKDSSHTAPQTLRLLLVHALVYSIWRQRNNLIHNQIVIPPHTIFIDVDRLIRNSITARRKRRNFRHLMTLWLI